MRGRRPPRLEGCKCWKAAQATSRQQPLGMRPVSSVWRIRQALLLRDPHCMLPAGWVPGPQVEPLQMAVPSLEMASFSV